MRKPKRSDCTDEHGNVDHECYDDAMSNYEDAERDRELEERMERKEEKERMADHSDQEKDEK